jgi:hypothetical protein
VQQAWVIILSAIVSGASSGRGWPWVRSGRVIAGGGAAGAEGGVGAARTPERNFCLSFLSLAFLPFLSFLFHY